MSEAKKPLPQGFSIQDYVYLNQSPDLNRSLQVIEALSGSEEGTMILTAAAANFALAHYDNDGTTREPVDGETMLGFLRGAEATYKNGSPIAEGKEVDQDDLDKFIIEYLFGTLIAKGYDLPEVQEETPKA